MGVNNCDSLQSESWHDYKVTKSIDDFMTRIDFLKHKSDKSKKLIVRKTVKDVEQGVPLVILCEIANYRLLKEYNLEWVGPRFLGYSWTNFNGACVYMEAGKSDLESMIYRLSDDPKIRMNYLEHVIKSCTLCLAACHSLGLIHSDPKPQNYLVYEQEGIAGSEDVPRITLCDFGYTSPYGLSRYNDDYRAPEVWITDKATVEADIWALGLTLLKYVVADTIIIANDITAKHWKNQDEFCLDDNMVESLDVKVFLPACLRSVDMQKSAEMADFSLAPTSTDKKSDFYPLVPRHDQNTDKMANFSHVFSGRNEKNADFDEEKLLSFHELSRVIFTMLRFKPSERSMPHYNEMDSFPIIEISKIKEEKIESFANLLLERYLEKNNFVFSGVYEKNSTYPNPATENMLAIKASTETISQKWYKGECAFEEIANKYKLTTEALEEAEKMLIDEVQGLIYLPSFLK